MTMPVPNVAFAPVQHPAQHPAQHPVQHPIQQQQVYNPAYPTTQHSQHYVDSDYGRTGYDQGPPPPQQQQQQQQQGGGGQYGGGYGYQDWGQGYPPAPNDYYPRGPVGLNASQPPPPVFDQQPPPHWRSNNNEGGWRGGSGDESVVDVGVSFADLVDREPCEVVR